MLNRFFFVLLVFIGSLSIIGCQDEATITTPLPTTSTEPPKDILPVKVTKLIVAGVRQFLARLIAIFTYTGAETYKNIADAINATKFEKMQNNDNNSTGGTP